MSKALANLIDNISLEQIDNNIFRGLSLHRESDRVYGGQVLAQAINAAQRTVAARLVLHSLHSYFLRPGDPDLPIIYEVDRIRDGRSFTTRRVVAIQRGRPLFNVSMSFQLEEEGFEHQSPMPVVDGPRGLVNEADRHRAMQTTDWDWPIEFRQVDPIDMHSPKPASAKSYCWFKSDGELADDLSQHQELLAYASDTPLLMTALRPYGVNQWTPGLTAITLDHCIWFHRPFRIDDWLLYELDSSNAGGGRGFVRGNVFNLQGQLVASVAQEGVIRLGKKD